MRVWASLSHVQRVNLSHARGACVAAEEPHPWCGSAGRTATGIRFVESGLELGLAVNIAEGADLHESIQYRRESGIEQPHASGGSLSHMWRGA